MFMTVYGCIPQENIKTLTKSLHPLTLFGFVAEQAPDRIFPR